MLTAVRKEKALAKVSLKTPVDSVTVHDTQDRLRLLSQASVDVREAGNIRAIDQAEADTFSVETVLADPGTPGPRSQFESQPEPEPPAGDGRA